MKKNYAVPTFTYLIFFLFNYTQAQVASLYTFTQSFAPYIAVGGGTVYGTITSDDVVFVDQGSPNGAVQGSSGPGIEIGFSFMYNNKRFDRVGISNDGWITLGQSALGLNAVNTNASNNYSGISASSTAPADLQNRIAILSRDLQGQTGSELRAVTIGASPNQTFVIQWSNYRKYNASGDAFDFQIRLSETTNQIELIYGTFINGAVAGLAEVGLRGNVNSDFSNRVTNTINTWSISIAGTINNASVLFNNTGLVPFYGQSYKWSPPQCSGTLAALSASTNASFICSGGASTISLLNSYTVSGITYTWSMAPTSTGPYTLVANTNSPYYAAGPIPSSSWFQAVSTCMNGGSTVTSSPLNVQVAAPTINSIPYVESFEGLILSDQLPNCSWLASNLSTVCRTYTASTTNNRIPNTGTKFAGFRSNTSPNGDYFYTNGLQLNAGVIYSASVGYITDGNAGWTNFSILYGTSQSSASLTAIASINSINNTNYFMLSNTFTVPNSGVYYIAIKCVANATPTYLSFDDIKVTIPCNLNAPLMSINASTTSICAGSPVVITAGGANSYSWNTGANTATITVTPTITSVYSATGTHTASGCSSLVSQTITVKSSPSVSLAASATLVCSGSSVNLIASGASFYTWNTTLTGNSILINPTVTTVYSVYGQNTLSCGAFASQLISVNPLPNISVISTAPDVLCLGETATLTASGAVNYQWTSPGIFLQSNPVLVTPSVSTSYTITGTDANSCINSQVFLQNVIICAGILNSEAYSNSVYIFPNPTNDDVTLILKDNHFEQWQLLNTLGEILKSDLIFSDKISIDLKDLSKNIYYLKLISGKTFTVLKCVKN